MSLSRHRLSEELALLRKRVGEVESELRLHGGPQPVRNRILRHGAPSPDAPQLALKGSDLGYWEWHILEDRTFISEEWASQLGYCVQDLAPGLRAWEQLVHPEDFPDALWRLESHLRGESEVYEAEFRMRSSSGSWRWILSKGRVVDRDGDGLPVRMTGVHIDVHRRRQEEELMKQLAEHLGDGVWLASVRPRSLLYANPAFVRILGQDIGQWLGQPLRKLLTLVHVDDRARVRRSFRAALENGHFDELVRFVRASGQVRHVRVRSFPIYDGHGELMRLSGSVQDVTELFTAREEKAALEEQLLHAQRIESIGRLAGGVAHDFNNVLTAILGNVALLRNAIERGERDPDLLHAGLGHIEQAAKGAASLTRQLLTFSRKQEIETELITPDFVLERCERILRHLIRENIELHIHTDEACWFLEADPSSMEQVVLNLAVNASDAMPRGGKLRIEARNVHLDEPHETGPRRRVTGAPITPGRYVRITVRDTGSGIADSMLDEVFGAYFTTKEAHIGTGLGLSIVHGIVTQARGHVVLETEPGKGTSFGVHLPALTLEDAQRQLDGSPNGDARVLHRPHDPEESAREHILVCEDQETVLDLTARVLEEAGYRVTRARDAQSALDDLPHDDAIDLLLTDVILPGASGLSLARSMRKRLPGLPVLYMTGYSTEELTSAGFEEGEVPLLRKPFEPLCLLSQVRTLLGPKQRC